MCKRSSRGKKKETEERRRNKRMTQDRQIRKEASIHFLQAVCVMSMVIKSRGRDPRLW